MYKILILLLLIVAPLNAQRTRSLEITTQPGASIWLDGVLRGVADDTGRLRITPVSGGPHTLRIRAFGFKELKLRVTAAQTTLQAPLTKTLDKAEIAFQNAEKVLMDNKEKAVDFYRDAIRLRPGYTAAEVGLARALADIGENESALDVIKKARRTNSSDPELSVVEGRIYRSEGEIDDAIESFERAVREGKGFQPEAHTGLGLIFKDEAESATSRMDYEEERLYYEEAAGSFQKAIDQLSGTESVVYLLLGEIYEKMHEKAKAIAVYRKFLRDMPDHEERTAVESFIVQLQKPEQ